MAVWRELRRSGAIPLGQAVWAIPDLLAARPLVERLNGLVSAANGTLLLLAAKGFGDADVARLERLYAAAREEEWAEFAADCGKYLAELDKEERLRKYTLAELEEEEQSLDRLRRWYRELRSRDVLAIAATTDPTTSLKQCEERFETFADHVYAALSSPTGLSTKTPRHFPQSKATMFTPKDWLDRIFEIGIIGKGLNGAAELLGGLLLLLVTPDRIRHFAAALTQGELSEDPHDFVARYLLHTANGLTGSAVIFGAIYLLVHGAVKVVLVIALLLNKLWAYPWMIIVLLIFIGYQVYRIALQPSAGLIVLTIFDAMIVALTWREYRRQRRVPEGRSSGAASASSSMQVVER